MKNKKILVVDNHPALLKFMSTLLKKKGHEVMTAEDGLSALEVLKSFVPDLMFIDLIMPNIGGDKLCRIIRTNPDLKDVYLIILSGIAAEESFDFIKIGANACLAKGPFNILADHVQEIIENYDTQINEGISKGVKGIENLFQREITKELLVIKRHFEVISNNICEGFVEMTKDGMIVHVNPAMAIITGIKEERLLSAKFPDIFDEPNKQIVQSILSKCKNLPQRIREDSAIFFNRRYLTVDIVPVKYDQYNTFIAILRDITESRKAKEVLLKSRDELEQKVYERTKELIKINEELKKEVLERKNAEDHLRVSEMRYKNIVADMPAMICRFISDGTLTFVNSSYCDYFNKSEKNLIGQNFFQFIPKEEQEKVKKNFLALTRAKPMVTYEHKVLGPDGTIAWQSWTDRALFNENGELVEYQSIGRDVTEVRAAAEEKERLEKQLQQSQKMEAIGTLAGGIAHDFNNILMGILGTVSLVLTEISETHPHFKKIKGIEEYALQGSSLTQQLLGFARVEKYHQKPINLNEVLKKSSEMFGRTKKEIRTHHKFKEKLWIVNADERQIDQVLLNLYVNAWQAMPHGGEIYLQTDNIILDEEYVSPFKLAPGKYVKISVTDTGIGMDKEIQQKIFDPFFTTKSMGRGTGLGLASAYKIIKNHSGIINVYSEKEIGTTFNIYLPANESKIMVEDILSEKIQKGHENLLLVDDQEMILDIGSQMLEKLGYRVIKSSCGKDAISIYKKSFNAIDMIIMDMIMPEMEASELYYNLRAINPEVKVLLSSGYALNSKASEILDMGCNGFIQKPFNLETLSKKLRDILDIVLEKSS